MEFDSEHYKQCKTLNSEGSVSDSHGFYCRNIGIYINIYPNSKAFKLISVALQNTQLSPLLIFW